WPRRRRKRCRPSWVSGSSTPLLRGMTCESASCSRCPSCANSAIALDVILRARSIRERIVCLKPLFDCELWLGVAFSGHCRTAPRRWCEFSESFQNFLDFHLIRTLDYSPRLRCFRNEWSHDAGQIAIWRHCGPVHAASCRRGFSHPRKAQLSSVAHLFYF